MNNLINVLNAMASGVTPMEAFEDLPPIDETGLFDKAGTLLPHPWILWDGYDIGQRAKFGHKHGIYSFPTTEAVTFIREIIDGRERQALEIGSGHGAWGKALGIRCTDSFLQRRKDVAANYAQMGQPQASYGAHVEKLEAIKAVRKYRPKVVVASWVTQKFRADRFCMRGNADGVDELRLLELVDEYILIGNTAQHGDKMILEDIKQGVSTHRLVAERHEYLASRATRGSDFIVHIKRK